MKILIDIDGCICKYPFKQLAKKHFNVDLNELAIYAYDLADVLGIADTAVNSMFKEQVFGKPIFIEDALATLQNWHNKHELVIYTNRTRYMSVVELTKWLTDNGIPFHGIDNVGCMPYDFCIDDSPAKLMKTNAKIKLLFNQPWNKKCLNITGQLKRVYSWQDINELVGVYEYV
jgi:uncharacterized HAD superfamily protein